MSDEFVFDDTETELTPADRRQLEQRAHKAERDLALHEAGLGHLDADQRNALFAVAGKEPTPDVLKEKAAKLYGNAAAAPEAPAASEAPAAPNPNLAAEERIASAASGGLPPAPPVAPLDLLAESDERCGPGALNALLPQAMEAIAASGLHFGQTEHDGQFVHLDGSVTRV